MNAQEIKYMNRELIINKKIVGIYYWWYITDDTYFTAGAGGTGRWIFELSRVLMSRGYHVMLFAKYDDGDKGNFNRHIGPYGIDIMSQEGFNAIREKQRFDYFINIGNLEMYNEYINCDKLYYMCHNNYVTLNRECDFDPHIQGKLVKFAVLSGDSKKRIIKDIPYQTTDKDFMLTTNGVDQSVYVSNQYNESGCYNKKNKMVWSSNLDRGLLTFIRYAYPLIKKEIPDFELDICTYRVATKEDIKKYVIDDDIHWLGSLSQLELAKRQKESKVWCYPNIGITEEHYFFHETFCITAVENALSKNAIICLGNKDGIQTVFNGYDGFLDGNLFNENDVFYISDFQNVGKAIAEMTIKAIKDDEYRQHLIDQTYNIALKYTWEYAADSWIKEWGDEEYVANYIANN